MSRTSRAPAPAAASRLSVREVLALDRPALVRTWQQLHGSAPARSISQPLLRRILAFDLQLQETGGWPVGLAERIARAGAAPSRTAPAAVPVWGGRLLREWNGVTHVVEIMPDGYLWNGQNWRSLSVIAREITGAHWSGPRFFGLKEDGAAGKARSRKKAVRTGKGSGDPSARPKVTPASTRTPRRDEVRP